MVSPVVDKRIASATDKTNSSALNESAAFKAFGTYELLEHILSYISPRQLFVIQRVDTAWKSLIQDSDELQKKMFLRANGTVLHPSALSLPRDMDEGPVYMQQIRTNMMAFRCTDREASPSFPIHGKGMRRCGASMSLRPSITVMDLDVKGRPERVDLTKFSSRPVRRFGNRQRTGCEGRVSKIAVSKSAVSKSEVSKNDVSKDEPSKHDKIRSQTGTTASWRDMLLTQPPVEALYHKNKSTKISDARSGQSLCTVYNPKGVTVGDFVDCCVKMRQQIRQDRNSPGHYRPRASLEFVVPCGPPNDVADSPRRYSGCKVGVDSQCTCIGQFFNEELPFGKAEGKTLSEINIGNGKSVPRWKYFAGLY